MRRRGLTSDVELFRHDCEGLRELFLFIQPSISLLFVCCRQCITLKYKFPPSTSLPLRQFWLKATELLICKLHFIPNDIISALRASFTLSQRPSVRQGKRIKYATRAGDNDKNVVLSPWMKFVFARRVRGCLQVALPIRSEGCQHFLSFSLLLSISRGKLACQSKITSQNLQATHVMSSSSWLSQANCESFE